MHTGNAIDRGGFSGTVVSENSNDLALARLNGNITDGVVGLLLIFFTKIFDAKQHCALLCGAEFIDVF